MISQLNVIIFNFFVREQKTTRMHVFMHIREKANKRLNKVSYSVFMRSAV